MADQNDSPVPDLLSSLRNAYVAAHVDQRVWTDDRFGHLEARTLITYNEFKEFAKTVWHAEAMKEPLYVTQIESLPDWAQTGELADVAAAARWATPPSWVVRKGELAGTHGPVAYLDVKVEGLRRMVALHEISHLLVDRQSLQGHTTPWASKYQRLIGEHVGEQLALLWQFEWEWWSTKAAEKAAGDPTWLTNFL